MCWVDIGPQHECDRFPTCQNYLDPRVEASSFTEATPTSSLPLHRRAGGKCAGGYRALALGCGNASTPGPLPGRLEVKIAAALLHARSTSGGVASRRNCAI